MANPQKITPFLWFDNQAEEAAAFYSSVFRKSTIDKVQRMGGAVKVVDFSLDGLRFSAMDAGPMFQLNPSISFYAVCETEAETDAIWGQLVDGGIILMPLEKYPWSDKYGWVQDRFGVSWQIGLGKLEHTGGQRFSPFLMFSGAQSGKAEEALHFYSSVFKPSAIEGILRYGPGEEGKEGTVNHAQFTLCGQTFMVVDSNIDHPFGFNEALSFMIDCEDQKEVDYYWDSLLSGGGQESMCGWLKDRFGVSWQVVPRILIELVTHPDPERAKRASAAMMQMRKIEIDKL